MSVSKSYGKAACNAATLLACGTVTNPIDAWTSAVMGMTKSMQRKGCPRNAFLGLCEEGIVRGIRKAPAGTYTNSMKNKAYALRAVEMLRRNPALTRESCALWRQISDGATHHNGQMDVVIALWDARLLALDDLSF
jgi:hypothetical protein